MAKAYSLSSFVSSRYTVVSGQSEFSRVSSIVVEEEADYYLKFNNIAGWQTLLLMQFFPQMYAVIFVYLYIWYGTAIFMVAFSFGCPSHKIPRDMNQALVGILYAGDIGFFIDWISMIIFRNVKWVDLNIKYRPRHGFVLFLELLSIIPYEPIYGILVKPNMRVYHTLRLRYCLRLVRLYAYFRQSREYVGSYGFMVYLLIYYSFLLLVVILTSGIYYIIRCEEKCEYADVTVMSDVIYSGALSIFFTGTGTPLTDDIKSHHIRLDTAVISLACFFIMLLFTSFFTCEILRSLLPQFHSMKRYYRCRRRIALWKKTMEWTGYCSTFERLVEEYSEITKTKEKGVSEAYKMEILPTIFHKDLALDISWVALKHTHLFVNEDPFFLRAISHKMIHKFLCPGEVVFKKNVCKHGLIYIISGNIDVLSEEDGETPIVTFTSGTCLGEATLAFGYPSVSTVISKDLSDVAILERRHLVELANLYPEQIRRLFKRIMRRYMDARAYRYLTEYQYRFSESNERIGVLCLKWLKMTLRKLLYDDQNVQDLYSKELLDEMEERVFCTRYLDLLVQSEYMGVATNSTFIKTKFPLIFRAGSLLLKFWECNILLHDLVLVITFPIAYQFMERASFIYETFYRYLTCVWMLDIYVQSSTAIDTKFVHFTTVSEIFLYRLSKLTFIIDLVAALPLEIVFKLMNGSFSKADAIMSNSNRLLKFYRVEMFFNSLQMSRGYTYTIYFKYFLYFLLLCYYVATLFDILSYLDMNVVAYQKYKSEFSAEIALNAIYYAYVLAAGFARDLCFIKFPFSTEFDTSMPLIGAALCLDTLLVIAMAHTTAMEAMKRIDEHAAEEFLDDVNVTMKVYGFEKDLQNRIMNYIDLHTAAMGTSFLFEIGLFKHFPHDLYVISKGIYPGSFLKNLPFFFHLDDRIVHLIAASSTIDLIPANETFKSYNEVCYEVYILLEGSCRSHYVSGERRTVGPGEVFCLLEAAFGMRSLLHITSLTTCRIISIEYSVLKRILFQYPKEYHPLEETVKYFPYWIELEKLVGLKPKASLLKKITVKQQAAKNVKYFGYHMTKKTKLYYELVIGFPQGKQLLRHFLLRVTFCSSGAVVFYWELFHCCCVVIYIFILFMSLVIEPTDKRWFIGRGVFEFFGIVDMYLRHHFSYFDGRNLEILHPYKTCLNYWRHAFLVDFIAWIPFEWSFMAGTTDWTVWKVNRLLQLYRVFRFVGDINKKKAMPRGCWRILNYAPVTILIFSILNYLILKTFCKRVGSQYECIPGTWLSSLKTKSTFNVYMHNQLFLNTIISGGSNYLITIQHPKEILVYLCSNCIGFLLHLILTAKMVSAHLALNRDLCSYQEAMQDLVKFLNYSKIDKMLKREMINHYEFIWATIKGKRIMNTFSVFKSYFKLELLYGVYGKAFEESTIFLPPNENFLRCLLVDAKHKLYLKTGIIYQVNDISGDIFILLKGKVEVVGADLNRLETLQVGSVFGNLDMVERGRRTLSMVTSGHVEALQINSMLFYKHLSKYPLIFRHFRKLTRFHVDYIQEGYLGINKNLSTYRVPSEVLKTLYKQQQTKACRTTVFKRNKIIQIWEEYIVHVIYVVHYTAEILNISCKTHFSMHILLYFFDLMHLVKIYLRLHTSYEDEYGRTIRLRGTIFKRYKNERFGLYFDLATLFPLESLALTFVSTSYYRRVFAVCRINRLARILSTLIYCKEQTEKLNVNVTWVRFRYLFLWIFLVQLNLAFFLKLSDTSTGENELKVYLRYLQVVIDGSRRSSDSVLEIDENLFRLCAFNFVLLCTIILSCVFMSECCAIILLLTHTASLYKHFVVYTKQFMKIENVSIPLRERIENYMNLLWMHHRGVQFPQLLEDCPDYLKEAVLYSMFGNHLMKDPVLVHCHKDLTRQMCLHMKTQIFFPDDNVVYMGDIDNCMYFIQEGEINALSEDTMHSEVIEHVLKEGDMFGLQQGLHPRYGHDFTYKCVKYSMLIVLNRNDWFHLLDFFPASKRMIYETMQTS